MSRAPLPETVAGYRVLRALARDDRADVLLVHSPVEHSLLEHGGADAIAQAVVAKLFVSNLSRTDVDRELAALLQVEHAHTQRLVDVGCTPDGRVAAVLARCERGSLGELLLRRERFDAGEVITILAPLCDAVETLHSAGVAHGRIAVSRVLFTAAGAPVLIGFGAAVMFAPDAPEVVRLRVPEVSADRDALCAVADALLTRVGGADQPRALAVLERVRAAPPAERLAVMRRALFEMAAGAAVRFDPDPPVVAEPAVLVAPAATRVSTLVQGTLERGSRVQRTLESGGGVRGQLVSLVARRWASQSMTRRRAIVATGAGVAALAIALTAVPAAPAATTHRALSRAVSSESPAPSSAARSTAPAPSSASARSTAPARSTDPHAAAVTGSDPVAATIALLAARERCIRELSTSCLTTVDETGSSAAAADRATISDISDGRTPTVFVDAASVTPMLAQSLGGAALISLGAAASPSSLLVTKNRTGWRIRDYAAVPTG